MAISRWPPPPLEDTRDPETEAARSGIDGSAAVAAREPTPAPAAEARTPEPEDTAHETREAAHAEGHAAGFEAGRAEGFEAGLAAGRDSATREAEATRLENTQAFSRLLEGVRSACVELDGAVEAQLAETLALILRKVVAVETRVNAAIMTGLVQDALQALHGDLEKVVVHVAPADLARIDVDALSVAVHPDSALEPGAIRLERGATSIHDALDQRLETALAQVLGTQP